MFQKLMFTRLAAAVAVAALGLGVTACSSDANSIAAQAQSGDGKGFVSGDGTIERVAPEQRSTPLTVSGTTLQGVSWTVADARGKVLVLNVWGQWCRVQHRLAQPHRRAHHGTNRLDEATRRIGVLAGRPMGVLQCRAQLLH